MSVVDQVVIPHVTPDGAWCRSTSSSGACPKSLVDGSLAAGAIPVDVDALGVAAYAIDAHRWLLGPRGWRRSRPVTGEARRGPAACARCWKPARSMGLRSSGMARSAGWLAMYVGLDWVTERTHALARRLGGRSDRHRACRGRHAAATPVGDRRVPAAALGSRRGVRRARAARRSRSWAGPASDGSIRASVGAWNTEAEIDRFTESVALIASTHVRDDPAAADAHDPPRGRLVTSSRPPVVTSAAGRGRRTSDGSAPALVGGPLAAVPQRAAAGVPGRGQQPVRGDRARRHLSRVRRRALARRGPAGRRPAHARGGGLRRDRPRRRNGDHLPDRSAATRDAAGPEYDLGRSAWSAALGFFAAVPIAYIVLVVVVQVLKPLLA